MLPMMQYSMLLVGIRFCALATGGFGRYRWRINHNGFIVTNDHASCLTPVSRACSHVTRPFTAFFSFRFSIFFSKIERVLLKFLPGFLLFIEIEKK